MNFSDVVPYKKLDYCNYDLLKNRQRFCKVGVCAWIAGMLFICILIMSLMIVKVSSAASFYQNKKPPTLTANNINRHNQIIGDPTTTTTTTALSVVAAHQPQFLAATEFMRPPLHPIKPPKHQKLRQYMVMRENQQQQQHHHQQLQQKQQQLHKQYYLQQQQQQQQHYQQQQQLHMQQLSHAIAGETAYLLERADNEHEQPIYGTWLTKAKRPPTSLVATTPATASATTAELATTIATTTSTTTAAATASAAMSVLGDNLAIDNNTEHYYERLPRRAATMTPQRSELHDQLPRPPRITSRQPSMLRRQTSHVSAMGRDDHLPKPFHFPHDGPLPQEFSKYPHADAERAEVNNIQDILKNLHLGGGSNMPPKIGAPMIMMPTGLHVAGSFKNYKSSGIANFFRNKRHKKHLQLAMPMPAMQMPMSMPMQMPMHWMSGYQPQLIAAYSTPTHQRIAMDQFYPYKARSPNDINLLAMQQQQLQSVRSKSKKKRKNPLAQTPSIMLPQSNVRPYLNDPYLQSYPYMFALNQSQKSKTKRVPFKLNLDIYPVATPTKDYKASAFTLDEAKVSSTARPGTAMRNPFAEYYPFPGSAASVSGAQPYLGIRDNLIINGLNMQSYKGKPLQLELPQPSNHLQNYKNSNPFYANLVSQQQQQQQQLQPQQNLLYSFPNQQSNLVTPVDTSAQTSGANSNPNSNQLLLHLNVFPKPNSLVQSSTNPFYNNNNNNGLSINRQTIVEHHAPPQPPPVPKIKPRCKGNKTTTAMPAIARSDNQSSTQSLIDFEHPIVAADVAPYVQALVDNKLEDTISQYTQQPEAHSNFRYNTSTNMDQIAAEAHAASLFRFPVEDLIQFQVDDAL